MMLGLAGSLEALAVRAEGMEEEEEEHEEAMRKQRRDKGGGN